MNAQAYDGYFENGNFYTAGRTVSLPERRRVVVTVFDEPVADPQRPKDPILAKGWDAMRAIQEDSVRNGTDKMTMEEIDEIISEVRQEKRAGV